MGPLGMKDAGEELIGNVGEVGHLGLDCGCRWLGEHDLRQGGGALGFSTAPLRMVALQQKLCGGWRTLTGAEAFLALHSYVATARKHGMNPLAVLRQLFEGHPWLPVPGPLPAPP
jgi:hypothetical protein